MTAPPPEELLSQRIGEIYVLLHMDCELKCKVCPYWGLRGACHDKEFRRTQFRRLETAPLKRFIDESLRYRPRAMTLSGGEPLLSPDWVDIASHARSRGLRVSLSTNGLHIPKYMDEIFELVDSIHISLGGTKEILQQTRVATFGFDEVVECLAEITARKRREGRTRPALRIIYVVSDLSYGHLVALVDQLDAHDIDIDSYYFQHVIYIDPESLRQQEEVLGELGFGSRLWRSYLYTPGPMDLDVLLSQMDQLSERDNVLFSPQLTRAELGQYYNPSTKGAIASRGRCRAPWTQVDVYPNGDVSVCPDYILGNLYEASLDDIWNGDRARQLRRHVLDHGGFPACTGCFYYYVSQEDPVEHQSP
jgi:radical SAM protein with 4Fe4S-binding SPASM domain